MVKKYNDTMWVPICIIKGFKNKSEAMKAEWRIKHPTNKKRPNCFNKDKGRILALKYILETSDKWTNTSNLISEQNLQFIVDINFKNLFNEEIIKKFNIEFNNIIY